MPSSSSISSWLLVPRRSKGARSAVCGTLGNESSGGCEMEGMGSGLRGDEGGGFTGG
jgi:hypothetical protein